MTPFSLNKYFHNFFERPIPAISMDDWYQGIHHCVWLEFSKKLGIIILATTNPFEPCPP